MSINGQELCDAEHVECCGKCDPVIFRICQLRPLRDDRAATSAQRTLGRRASGMRGDRPWFWSPRRGLAALVDLAHGSSDSLWRINARSKDHSAAQRLARAKKYRENLLERLVSKNSSHQHA